MKSLLVVFVSIAFTAFGQFDVNTYLSKSSNDIEIQALNAQWDYIGETDFKSPFFREYEFRARARGFESGFDDFRFRFSPLNPYERKANKQYASVLDNQMESQSLVEYASVLEKRYKLLIKHIYFSEIIELKQASAVYYKKLLDSKAKQGISKDLIAIDRKLLTLELSNGEFTTEILRVENLIRSGYDFGGNISWENFSLVTIESIEEQLQLNQQENVNTNYLVQNEINKMLLAESNYEINRQESFSNIGYIQAEYRPYRGETAAETLGMQIAFQLPIVNPDRPDLERRKLRLLKDHSDIKAMEEEVKLDYFNFNNKLESGIKQYKRIQDKLSTLNKLDRIGLTDVETMIVLKEYKDDLNELSFELYAQILSNYIRVLQTNSRLSAAPYRNYLSETGDSFEIN